MCSFLSLVMATNRSESIPGMNKEPTCDNRSTNPTSILSVVGDNIPELSPISIGDRDERICLPRLFSKHISQSFMQPLRKSRIELHKSRSKYHQKRSRYCLTLYKLPSAPTSQPSARYPFLRTTAAIPQALSLAARRPINRARARKNWRSARVVDRA